MRRATIPCELQTRYGILRWSAMSEHPWKDFPNIKLLLSLQLIELLHIVLVRVSLVLQAIYKILVGRGKKFSSMLKIAKIKNSVDWNIVLIYWTVRWPCCFVWTVSPSVRQPVSQSVSLSVIQIVTDFQNSSNYICFV